MRRCSAGATTCTTARGRWCVWTWRRGRRAIRFSTEPSGLVSHGSLYRNTPIADDATLLLTGTTDEATEPVAWTRMNAGGRVFYTSLGHQEDFRDGRFSGS